MKLIERPKYGPLHRFTDYHVYKTLSVLSDGTRKGRKQLADKVGVGEGSMRTIVECIRDKGYIDVKQTGIKITKKGSEFFNTIPLQIYTLGESDLVYGKSGVAVQVKGVASKIGSGMEQRDRAMIAGADGATTVLVKKGKLQIPGDIDLESIYPDTASTLNKLFDLEDEDIVIIGTSAQLECAEEGAVAAALDLL
ncbi:DUF4443 domain-containing protein [Candidatus Methanomassiliicoccus intestinalis]|uniref:DUF4443 domain-containing protein n=1 Tax=Candidatus Methanomassiliicoccus intestinalis TaxID=1406512 RepID=UPI0037DD4930